MRTQTIDLKTPDGLCDAFVAYPQEEGRYPAVLFFMDAFGPRAWLYEMAQTIASHGFYVLLPNVFYRMRRAPVVDMGFPVSAEGMPELRKQIMPFFQNFKAETAIEDTKVFIDFLARQKQVLPDRVGVTGYCMGGGLAIRVAAHYPDRIKAAASFHAGKLATQESHSPHLLLPQIKASLYIAHADHDPSMPPEQIERLNKALAGSGIQYEAELYEGASHGFTMADIPAYHEPSLQRHWQKLFGLLERSLKS